MGASRHRRIGRLAVSLPSLTVLAVLAVLSPGPLAAQLSRNLQNELLPSPAIPGGTPAGTDSGAEESGPPALPPVAELIPRVVSLAQEADQAIDTVRGIASISELEAGAASLSARQEEVGARVDEIRGKGYVRDERVQAILDQAVEVQNEIDKAMAVASDQVGRLDELRSTWQQTQDFWQRWRGQLREDAQYASVYRDQLQRADKEVARVLQAANRALPDLVGLQQRLQAIDAASRKTVESAQRLRQIWRENLFRRTVPPLLSAGFRAELEGTRSGGLLSAMADAAWGETPLTARMGAILALQLAVALLLGWALRRLRRQIPTASHWASVLDHPWAIGVLVAAAGLGFLYGPLPPLGRFGLGLAIAVSVVLVAAGMFDNRFKRWTVDLISAAYVLFAGLEAVALPVPLQRLVLAGLSLCGILVILALARGSARSMWSHQRWFAAVLRAGALALAAVIAAELFGFHAFAQWLLEASVVTAFVGFVVTFLVRLGRGGVSLLMRSAETLRAGSLARLGDILAERLLFLLQVVVIGAALLYLAVVWNLSQSVGDAWRGVIGAGIMVGERHFTVGRLLLSGLAVYLALVASWVLRSLLDRAVFEHRRFDRGVRDSIATLLHYMLIVVGVFVALSVFGVDLSNLALIAGALSVGIGFGLQNVINNFVSGLILLFERPVRIGDIVVLGEEQGTITKIGMRSTVLTTFNGAELIVPNADLISQKVVNWTLSTPRARLVIPVSVSYGNDPERVIRLLREVGEGYGLALDDPAPMAIFTGFGDSSLDFELRVWLGAFEQLLQARSELASAITRRFAEEGLEIPFPQRDLHLRTVDPAAGHSFAGGPQVPREEPAARPPGDDAD